jgi:hypothetical protein
MDQWETDRETQKALAVGKLAQADRESATRDNYLRSFFPDKQELMIAKLDKYVLDWNKRVEIPNPAKRLEFKEINKKTWRISTLTTYPVTYLDGTRRREFLELDIKFDQLGCIVHSVLEPTNDDVLLQLHEGDSSSPSFYRGRHPIHQGQEIGALLQPLLAIIDPISKN